MKTTSTKLHKHNLSESKLYAIPTPRPCCPCFISLLMFPSQRLSSSKLTDNIPPNIACSRRSHIPGVMLRPTGHMHMLPN